MRHSEASTHLHCPVTQQKTHATTPLPCTSLDTQKNLAGHVSVLHQLYHVWLHRASGHEAAWEALAPGSSMGCILQFKDDADYVLKGKLSTRSPNGKVLHEAAFNVCL
ncbi:hypothetical protein M758_4G141200 [Ceratodon purpureus]|nr:hypothetical protein M758_4G141200 [Ceratodon purpureus]